MTSVWESNRLKWTYQSPFRAFDPWHDSLYKCYFTKSLINQSASPRTTPLIVSACWYNSRAQNTLWLINCFLKKQPLTNNPEKDNIKMILRNFTKIFILTTFFLSLHLQVYYFKYSLSMKSILFFRFFLNYYFKTIFVL